MEASIPERILAIKIEKSEERLTSLGGLVVLEEMAQALRVGEQVDQHLRGPGSGRGGPTRSSPSGVVNSVDVLRISGSAAQIE